MAGINSIGRMTSARSCQPQEVAQQPGTGGRGPLRMELRSPEVVASHDGGDRRAVVRPRDRHFALGYCVAVNEIEVLSRLDLLEQRILPRVSQLIPAHVRHRALVVRL